MFKFLYLIQHYQYIYSCIIININTGGIFKIENLEQFLQHYGYIAVFIGTFIEGEIFLLIVGIFIKVGLLSPVPALISAILGAFTHELIYFFFGRWKGREFLLKNAYTRKKYRKAKQLVEKYGDVSIFIIRFLYGMRVIPMVFLGAARFNPVRFAVIDLISLLIWSFIYICLGYFFGHAAEKYFGKTKEIYILIGFGIAVIALLIIFLKMYREKRAQ